MKEKKGKTGEAVATAEERPAVGRSWISVVIVNIFMVFVGVFIAVLWSNQDVVHEMSAVLQPDSNVAKLLGSKGALLFRSLDTNKDGDISCTEFGPIVEKLTGEVSIIDY